MGLALLATLTLSARTPAAAASAPVPLLDLDVLLTIAPDLADLSRRTLLAEVERIWRREHVQLRWPAAPGGTERPAAPIRVLVIARAEVAGRVDRRWPVGELFPDDGHRALAIASISGARRVVAEASRNRVLDLPALTDYRLGLVLGRAVAHEIGHFLLATGTHADSGLMRATVGAREFADMGAVTFALDDDAGRWLRQRLLDGVPAVGAVRAAGFSYTR